MALIVTAPGCGLSAVIGTAVALSLGGGSKGSAPAASVIQVVSPTSRAQLPSVTSVPLGIKVIDPSGGLVTVDATWSVPGQAPTYPATPDVTSANLTQLPASATGVVSTFVWAAQGDLTATLAPTGSAKVASVVLHLTPRRGSLVGTTVDVPLVVGSTPPRVSIGGSSPLVVSGTTTTFATLQSDGSDPVSLALFVSAPGVTRKSVPIIGTSSGLETSPGGVQSTVVWDSVAALGYVDTTATIELDVTDRFGQSGQTTASVQIRNEDAPSVLILGIGAANGPVAIDGRVPIRFAVQHPKAEVDPTVSGRADVTLEVSADNGVTFKPATGLPLSAGSRLLGLASLLGLRAHAPPMVLPEGQPGSNSFTFLWDSLADSMGGIGPTTVAVRITATTQTQAGPVVGTPTVSIFTLASSGGFLSATRSRVLVSPSTIGFAVSDIRMVGLPDLVITHATTVGVRRKTSATVGSTAFNAEATVISGVTPAFGATVADIDGDGAQDVVVADGTSQSLLVYKGSGAGTFAALSTVSLGATPVALAVVDLNSDGRPDFLTAFASGVARVHLNAGGGSFSAAPSLALSGVPVVVRAADVDGDQTADVVVGYADGRFGILPGRGDGTFGPEATFSAGTSISALVIADQDGDGRPDVVLTDPVQNRVMVFRNQGGGVFSQALSLSVGSNPVAVACVDFDGDGTLDLVVLSAGSNDVSYFRGLGRGRVSDRQIVAGDGTVMVIADVTNDGLPDVVTADSGNVFVNASSVFLSLGNNSQTLTATTPTSAAAADFNGDARFDLAYLLGAPSFALTISGGLGNGAFTTASSYAEPNGTSALALADLNLDGLPDVAFVDSSGVVHVRLGQAGLAFGPELATIPTGPNPVALRFADLNGDGRPDLIVVNQGSNDISVRLGNGDGTFGAETRYSVGTVPSAVAVGDVNGDGLLDVVVANTGSNDVSLRLGMGGGVLGPETRLAMDGNFVRDVALGDMDGDGRLDMVVLGVEPTNTNIVILVRLGDGKGGFQPGPRSVVLTGSAQTPSGNQPRGLALADLHGEGDLDVAFTDGISSIRIARNLRTGTAGSSLGIGRGDGLPGSFYVNTTRSTSLSTGPLQVLVGDFKGSGAADVLAIDGEGYALLIGNGTRGSQAEPALSGLAGQPVRSARISRIDLGAVSTVTLGASVARLAQASYARAFTPEATVLSASTTITLPLHATLTSTELRNALLRVFRYEQERGSSNDPRTGLPFTGTIVEVARVDSSDPMGAMFPPGVVPATLDPVMGTVSFPIGRLGRYQVFLQAPDLSEHVMFRETFDGAGQDPTRLGVLPAGWTGSANWLCGAATVASLAASQAPAAGSAPNLMAIGLRANYRNNANDSVTSPAFGAASPPLGASVLLRFLEWHDIELTNDQGSVRLVVTNPATGAQSVQLVGSAFTGTSPGPVVLSPVEIDVTAALNAGLAAVGNPSSASVQVRFTLTSNATVTGRGWWLDDVVVVQKR